MENEVVEPAAAPVEPAAPAPAPVDHEALCKEAIAWLQALVDRVTDPGVRSTIAFVIGRFEAELLRL